MDAIKVKNALIEQRKIHLSGNLYYKTQIDFAYNTNHIEGSTITKDETTSIYDTGTIIADKDQVIVVKDVTEVKNHFTLFKYMLDTLEDELSENMIKKYHLILKRGTVDEDSDIVIGDYKRLKNFVSDIETSLPQDVPKDMKELLDWYNSKQDIKLEDIIEFHVRFESIHPFQDGNGRVGRMIMFRECLVHNIMPFYIEDRNKPFYIKGLNEYQKYGQKTRLIDTCLNSQDNYERLAEYFLE